MEVNESLVEDLYESKNGDLKCVNNELSPLGCSGDKNKLRTVYENDDGYVIYFFENGDKFRISKEKINKDNLDIHDSGYITKAKGGVYYFSNGDKWEGDIRNGKKVGKGKFFIKKIDQTVFDEKVGVYDIYVGEYNQDGYRTLGRLFTGRASGQTQEIQYGLWKLENVGNEYRYILNGYGQICERNGGEYIGLFKNGKLNGKGTYEHGNGYLSPGEVKKYDGNFEDGFFNGKGYCIYESYPYSEYDDFWNMDVFADPTKYNDVYKGNFKRGLRCGYGEMKYANGDKYYGIWDSDKRKKGEIFYAKSGNVFEGTFGKDGSRQNGSLSVYDHYGNRIYEYNGTFDDKVFIDDEDYTKVADRLDEFKDTDFTGEGVITYDSCKNGIRSINGYFKKGEVDVKKEVTIEFANGVKYVGKVKYDGDHNLVRHGKGKVIYPSGETVFCGEWKNDKLISSKNHTLYYSDYSGDGYEIRITGRFVEDDLDRGLGVRVNEDKEATMEILDTDLDHHYVDKYKGYLKYNIDNGGYSLDLTKTHTVVGKDGKEHICEIKQGKRCSCHENELTMRFDKIKHNLWSSFDEQNIFRDKNGNIRVINNKDGADGANQQVNIYSGKNLFLLKTYKGELNKNNDITGKGEITIYGLSTPLSKIKGQFNKGEIDDNKEVELTFKNGIKYKGGIKLHKDKKGEVDGIQEDGFGIISYPDGSEYSGKFDASKPIEFGKFTYINVYDDDSEEKVTIEGKFCRIGKTEAVRLCDSKVNIIKVNNNSKEKTVITGNVIYDKLEREYMPNGVCVEKLYKDSSDSDGDFYKYKTGKYVNGVKEGEWTIITFAHNENKEVSVVKCNYKNGIISGKVSVEKYENIDKIEDIENNKPLEISSYKYNSITEDEDKDSITVGLKIDNNRSKDYIETRYFDLTNDNGTNVIRYCDKLSKDELKSLIRQGVAIASKELYSSFNDSEFLKSLKENKYTKDLSDTIENEVNLLQSMYLYRYFLKNLKYTENNDGNLSLEVTDKMKKEVKIIKNYALLMAIDKVLDISEEKIDVIKNRGLNRVALNYLDKNCQKLLEDRYSSDKLIYNGGHKDCTVDDDNIFKKISIIHNKQCIESEIKQIKKGILNSLIDSVYKDKDLNGQNNKYIKSKISSLDCLNPMPFESQISEKLSKLQKTIQMAQEEFSNNIDNSIAMSVIKQEKELAKLKEIDKDIVGVGATVIKNNAFRGQTQLRVSDNHIFG